MKKGITPVVATTLLLLVAVIGVFQFEEWFNYFQSSSLTDLDDQSLVFDKLSIQSVNNGELYILNPFDFNVSVNKFSINDVYCAVPLDLVSGMNIINISTCLIALESGFFEFVLVGKNAVIEDRIFID